MYENVSDSGVSTFTQTVAPTIELCVIDLVQGPRLVQSLPTDQGTVYRLVQLHSKHPVNILDQTLKIVSDPVWPEK